MKRVRGAQAEMVYKDLGLVKITRASAKNLFEAGIPFVVAPSKVNSFHFFKGWNLAFHFDPKEPLERGYTFDVLVNHWNAYSELGQMAFFVDEATHLAETL